MAELLIELRRVEKSYSTESHPWRRLWGQLSGRTARGPQLHVLHDINLGVRRGEVVGVVGRNGAGKSTLLQIVCGVLEPSRGERIVKGRIAALLELGAGFNPELTGRENVRLNGPLLGLSSAEVERRMDGIVQFAGIGEFIDQPVRSYSSGMFVRLAFAMATSMEPDILVVDEALSVGDGAFARKSFDRIMDLKEAGTTILFCSHSMHPIEAICSRALWIEGGRIVMDDVPARTVAAYNTHLAMLEDHEAQAGPAAPTVSDVAEGEPAPHARIVKIEVSVDGLPGRVLSVKSLESELRIDVDFEVTSGTVAPSVAVGIVARNGSMITSAGSVDDGMQLKVAADGTGRGSVVFPRLPLLKGEYFVRVFLGCERGIHVYEHVDMAADLIVSQHGLAQGYVSLPRQWPGATRA